MRPTTFFLLAALALSNASARPAPQDTAGGDDVSVVSNGKGNGNGNGNGHGNGNGNGQCNGNGNGKGNKCGPQRKLPNTVVLDPQRMVDTAAHVMGYQTEFRNLLTQANEWMGVGPWTVVSKTMAVPNGTAHDYASQAPYWWANNWENPSEGDKCPYIQRDGIRNPEVDNYTDRRDGASMMTSTYLLSLAWWYTNDVSYRVQAAAILRTWFLNPGTKMNPHLEHAQIVPCKNSGRAIGIIDFSQQYTDVIDAVSLLNTEYDLSWNQTHADAFTEWNRQFLTWLTDSEFGQEELRAKNNHNTFAAMQIAALAAWLGDKATAAKYLEDQKTRIDQYVAPNGTLPQEIIRPTSFHYTTFTLVAYLRMVAIGRLDGVNVDLWGYQGPDGQSIQKAVEFILPYASGQEPWPYPELHFQPFAAYGIVHYAADMGMEGAKQVLGQLEEPLGGGTWALAPAVQQLDSILLLTPAPTPTP